MKEFVVKTNDNMTAEELRVILAHCEVEEVGKEKPQITISKNKLILLSKLIKDLKNEYKEQKGKEKMIYKLRTQRRLIETFFDEDYINTYIDSLKQRIANINLKKQLKEETDEDF